MGMHALFFHNYYQELKKKMNTNSRIFLILIFIDQLMTNN